MILPLSPKLNTLYSQDHDGRMGRYYGLQLYNGNIMYGHLGTETHNATMCEILKINKKVTRQDKFTVIKWSENND